MLTLVKHAKVSTVTFSFDLRFRGQRSKRSNFKQCQIAKLTMPTCWPWSNMQKSPRWTLRPTYISGVKGQKRSNIKHHRMAKLTVPTCWPGQQRSNFKQRQSAKLLLPTRWPWKNMQNYRKRIHGDLFDWQILNKIKWFYVAYMLAFEKHAKFFMVTSLPDVPLWGKRSKNMDNFKQRQIANSTRWKVKHE